MAADTHHVRRILENLRQGFIAQLPVRLAAIEQCWIDCFLAPDPAPALHELVRLAHNLRGSAKTYGLMALGDAAGELESALHPWLASESAPDPHSRATLDGLVAALRAATLLMSSNLDDALAPPAKEAVRPTRLVYLLEDDPAQARLLVDQLAHFGYRVEAYSRIPALLTAVERERPAACILDIILEGDALAGIGGGLALQQRDAALPLLFASVRDDIEARLGAVRAGGRAYLTKPIDTLALIEELDRLTGRMTEAPYRILVVEDDASLARHYQALLTDAGMESMTLTEPLQVLQAMADFTPDLILIDLYMPQCSGAELARVIRQRGTNGGLPIVFLSGECDPEIQYATLQHGGDDFLTKPVDGGVLLRTLTLRAQRARLMNTLMMCDGMTGLLNHSRIKERLITEVARARRLNTPLSVAMLDLDHFKEINDRHGHLSGDRVIKSLVRLLRERLRASDLAGRYGGEEFLLILPDCELDAALRLVDDVRARFSAIVQHGATPERTFNASFSAGLAAFPLANTPENLLLGADAALYAAKRAGRNCTR